MVVVPKSPVNAFKRLTNNSEPLRNQFLNSTLQSYLCHENTLLPVMKCSFIYYICTIDKQFQSIQASMMISLSMESSVRIKIVHRGPLPKAYCKVSMYFHT